MLYANAKTRFCRMTERVALANSTASAARRGFDCMSADLGGFECDVRTAAHRQPKLGPGQRGRIIDAVADHRHPPLFRLQSGDDFSFIGRQHPSVHPLDPDGSGDGSGGGPRYLR